MDPRPDTVHFFWSGPFSQWYQSNFEYEGHSFVTAEQAMMYAKAMLFNDHKTAEKIIRETEPGKQKALGRQVRNFKDEIWDANKVALVTEINLAKFSQNKGLRRKLFQTAPKFLVEASPMDVIWGIGLDEANAKQTTPDQWPGQNLLGQILTEVRNKLSETHPDEALSVSAEI